MLRKEHKSELYVITVAKDLGNYIFTVTDKSPKKFRGTIVSKLQNLSTDIIENLYRANMVYVKDSSDISRMEKRKEYQREAYVSVKLLDYFSWMGREQQCILQKQQEQIAEKTAEILRLLVAWANSDKKKWGQD